MPLVKLLNKKYNFETDVTNLIAYVFNKEKTMFPRPSRNYLIGIAPDMICSGLPGREGRAATLFRDNHDYWGKTTSDLIHQIVISFEAYELNNPYLAWTFAYEIAQDYFSKGYFCCFGVHLNTEHIHIHFVVDNVSYVNGNSFFIPGEILELQAKAKRFCEVKSGPYQPAIQS